jgi:hypothetical protein
MHKLDFPPSEELNSGFHPAVLQTTRYGIQMLLNGLDMLEPGIEAHERMLHTTLTRLLAEVYEKGGF